MATIGPTLEKQEDLRQAIEAGARWIRLPCGYRQRPHVENARIAQAAAIQAGLPIQLLLDLPSSRPRTGTMQDLCLAVGDKVVFWDPEANAVSPEKNWRVAGAVARSGELVGKLAPSQRMWFCDGRLNFVVIKCGTASSPPIWSKERFRSSRPIRYFYPTVRPAFAAITPLDRELLTAFAAARLMPDWVALSLIASPAGRARRPRGNPETAWKGCPRDGQVRDRGGGGVRGGNY